MRVDDIEIFLTLEKTRSLSQAAEQLYISRPGLSQKLAAIEAEYGKELYTRTSSGVIPTKAGQIVTRYAHEISRLESAMAAELAAEDEHFSSTIEVGMSLNDGAELLPQLVTRFRQHHPEALVHLEAGYEPGLVEKVKKGELDFALVENQSVDSDISSETLGYDYLEFCAPNKPPYNTSPQPVKIKTLLEWPMIIYKWDSGRHMVGNRHFRERFGLSLMDQNMVAYFDTHEAMINGTKSGLGWSAIPHCIARKHHNDPGIIWFSIDTDPMRYPVDLIWCTDRTISPLASAFRQFIIENIPETFFRASLQDPQ